ncbi:uncharacterized protein LOC120207390 [Hibiscus syriacus]|uniref:uncharacterized protein LOC120207390 n=1 Tax=Hibiscus syriacus TaxID=106335 RepID=UPI0019221FF6|nr:uncharacterized protein LOC120207390 [Hibiscus syriacus]
MDASCAICGSEKKIWTMFQENAQRLNIKDWKHKNLTSPTYFARNPDAWDMLFGAITWNIWNRRNKQIFDPDNIEREPILDRSRRLVEEMNRAVIAAKQLNSNAGQHTRQKTRWTPPPPGWVKINSDGARDRNTSMVTSEG